MILMGIKGTKLSAARLAQLKTLAQVHAVQKHFSPVTIIQRFYRGFQTRMRLLVDAYECRVLPYPSTSSPPFISSYRRPPVITPRETSERASAPLSTQSPVRVPLPGVTAGAGGAATAFAAFEPSTSPGSWRSLSLQTDVLSGPAALPSVLFEERLPLSPTHTSGSFGVAGVPQPPPSVSSPPPPVASGFRHSRATARPSKAPNAQTALMYANLQYSYFLQYLLFQYSYFTVFALILVLVAYFSLPLTS